jgi:hypothetical protein
VLSSVQKHLLYWYKSTNTDAHGAASYGTVVLHDRRLVQQLQLSEGSRAFATKVYYLQILNKRSLFASVRGFASPMYGMQKASRN